MFFRGKKDKAYYEDSLREVFAIDSFHESQWDVIRRLLKKKRILLIEKTGFGKSLCYQFPATQIDGVTLVFSPLISLMRDQVTQMNDLNIPSTMIFGGQSPEEKAAILESSKKGKYKLLYIAPERQETEAWNELMSSLNVGMIVVDEAHCISEWGHDFRPAYQKIIETVSCVNKKIPILATTATATDSVIKDVLSQIGRAKVLRGSLNRPMFELSVVRVLDDMAKYCYLKENAERWDGVGLIYCRTRSDTECYAAFLRSMGINAMAYHGGMSHEKRKELETGLMNNSYKVVVSTCALGMGLNKKDIRFVIHTQMPPSLLDYYQETGRAGRDGGKASLTLLYSPKDERPLRRQIEKSMPDKTQYQSILDSLARGDRGVEELLEDTNLSKRIMKVALVELVKRKAVLKTARGPNAIYQLKRKTFRGRLPDHSIQKDKRLADLARMTDYCQSHFCRMKYLRNYLNDKTRECCGHCDSCLRERLYFVPMAESHSYVRDFWLHFHPELDLTVNQEKKNSPQPKTPLTKGVACSYYGKTEMAAYIRQAKYGGMDKFPGEVLERAVLCFNTYYKATPFDVLIYVPPTRSGDLVKDFAIQLSDRVKIPIHHGLAVSPDHHTQKDRMNLLTKARNIRNKYQFHPKEFLRNKRVLLVDDICDTGITIIEIARYLGRLGVSAVSPLVMAKTVSSDE